ncbi:MAG: hypothetical protein M3N41_07090, partial [Acidobacteriota bacterium]|nr:hypothetical protein [Acidobacteriota bacterium]
MLQLAAPATISFTNPSHAGPEHGIEFEPILAAVVKPAVGPPRVAERHSSTQPLYVVFSVTEYSHPMPPQV